MPEIDLGPGEYQERKPKGWRWKLPWAHPVAARTPFVGMLVALGFVAFFILNLPAEYDRAIVGAVALFAVIAGAMFILAFHDN